MKKSLYEIRDKEINEEIIKRRETRKTYYRKRKERLKKSSKVYKNSISFKKINASNMNYNDEFSDFKYDAYNFVEFENTKWGKSISFNENDIYEVREKSFYYVDFKKCNFQNLMFNGCHFYGCIFDECSSDSGKLIFQNCVLRGLEMDFVNNEHVNLELISEFKNCKMLIIEIRNSLIDNTLFDNSTFINSKIESSEMPGSIFNSCSFHGMNLIDSDMDKLKIKDTENYGLQFHDTRNIVNVDTEIYISKINISKDNKTSEIFKDLSKLYFTLYKLLDNNSINEEYIREYSYYYNYYSMKSKNNTEDKIIPFFSWLLFGFGERMGRFIFWFSVFIIGFASTYMFTGINNSTDGSINYSLVGNLAPFDKIIEDFMQCIHFSIITFSTVGYGNITPTGWSLLVSAIQVIWGLGMVALFTSVIVKKILK